MDAFEVLQTTLGPALRAVEQGNQNRLLVARDQMEQRFRGEQLKREQDFRMGEQEREQGFRKSEREAGEQFTKSTEERQRSYKKDDELDAARKRAIAAGLPIKQAMGMKAEELESVLKSLEQRKQLSMDRAEAEGKILNKASLLNVETNDPETGLPRSIDDIKIDTVRAEREREAQAEFEASQQKIAREKQVTGWDNIRDNFADDLIAKQDALAAWSEKVPKLSEMSGDNRGVIAKLYANDQQILDIVNELPVGQALADRLKAGDPDAVDQVKQAIATLPKSKEDLRARFYNAAMLFNSKAQSLITNESDFSQEVKAYLTHISKIPQELRNLDERLRDWEKAYPALKTESYADLIARRKAQLNPFSPQESSTGNPLIKPRTTPLPQPRSAAATGAAAQAPAAAKAMAYPPGKDWSNSFIGLEDSPPTYAKAVIPTPSTPVDLGSPQRRAAYAAAGWGQSPQPYLFNGNMYGPSIAEAPPEVAMQAPYPLLRNALIARSMELLQQQPASRGNDALMSPFYGGVASALNVPPQQVGSSVYYQQPLAVLANNMDQYGPKFDALPDDVKKALIINAIGQSYQNPNYRAPSFNYWQTSPTPNPFE